MTIAIDTNEMNALLAQFQKKMAVKGVDVNDKYCTTEAEIQDAVLGHIETREPETYSVYANVLIDVDASDDPAHQYAANPDLNDIDINQRHVVGAVSQSRYVTETTVEANDTLDDSLFLMNLKSAKSVDGVLVFEQENVLGDKSVAVHSVLNDVEMLEIDTLPPIDNIDLFQELANQSVPDNDTVFSISPVEINETYDPTNSNLVATNTPILNTTETQHHEQAVVTDDGLMIYGEMPESFKDADLSVNSIENPVTDIIATVSKVSESEKVLDDSEVVSTPAIVLTKQGSNDNPDDIVDISAITHDTLLENIDRQDSLPNESVVMTSPVIHDDTTLSSDNDENKNDLSIKEGSIETESPVISDLNNKNTTAESLNHAELEIDKITDENNNTLDTTIDLVAFDQSEYRYRDVILSYGRVIDLPLPPLNHSQSYCLDISENGSLLYDHGTGRVTLESMESHARYAFDNSKLINDKYRVVMPSIAEHFGVCLLTLYYRFDLTLDKYQWEIDVIIVAESLHRLAQINSEFLDAKRLLVAYYSPISPEHNKQIQKMYTETNLMVFSFFLGYALTDYFQFIDSHPDIVEKATDVTLELMFNHLHGSYGFIQQCYAARNEYAQNTYNLYNRNLFARTRHKSNMLVLDQTRASFTNNSITISQASEYAQLWHQIEITHPHLKLAIHDNTRRFLSDSQRQLYSNYAHSLINSGQDIKPNSNSFSNTNPFSDIVLNEGQVDVVSKLTVHLEQYEPLNKTLSLYIKLACAYTKRAPKTYLHYLSLLQQALVNNLTALCFVAQIYERFKSGIMPLLVLYDLSDLEKWLGGEKSLLEAYHALFNAVMGDVRRHSDKEQIKRTSLHDVAIAQLPRRLSRLHSVLNHMLNNTESNGLADFELNAGQHLMRLFEQQTSFVLTDLVNYQALSAQKNVVVKMIANTPLSSVYDNEIIDINPQYNDVIDFDGLIITLNDVYDALYLFQPLPAISVFSVPPIESLPTLLTTNGINTSSDLAIKSDYVYPLLSFTLDWHIFLLNKWSLDTIKNNINHQNHDVKDALFAPIVFDKAVFVQPDLIFHQVDFNPVNYDSFLKELKEFTTRQWQHIELVIKGFSDEFDVVERLSERDFNVDYENYGRLSEREKLAYAYSFIMPDIPDVIVAQIQALAHDYYPILGWIAVPKKDVCEHFSYHNTPAMHLLVGINPPVFKDFFYQRPELILNMGIDFAKYFKPNDLFIDFIQPKMTNDSLPSCYFMAGTPAIQETHLPLFHDMANKGILAQTHLVQQTLLWFDMKTNDFKQSPLLTQAKRIIETYHPTSGLYYHYVDTDIIDKNSDLVEIHEHTGFKRYARL